MPKKEPTQARAAGNGIKGVLDKIIAEGDFIAAIHKEVLGSREKGAYPGRIGKDTVSS